MNKIKTPASDHLQSRAKEQVYHGYHEGIDVTIKLAQVEQMMVFNELLRRIVESGIRYTEEFSKVKGVVQMRKKQADTGGDRVGSP